MRQPADPPASTAGESLSSPASQHARAGLYIAVWLLAVILAGLLTLVILPGRTPDSDYITYRFAMNLAAGHGLQFGTPATAGPAVSAYPLVPCVLAVLRLVNADLPAAATLLTILLSATSGALLFYLGGRQIAAVVASLALILTLVLLPSITLTALLTLSLLALTFARAGRWTVAGILAGGVVLTAPSGIFLAAIILIAALMAGRWRRFVSAVVLTTAIGLVPLVAAFGLPLHLAQSQALSVLLAIPALFMIAWQLMRRDSTYALAGAMLSVLAVFGALSATVLPEAGPAESAKTAGEWVAANTGPSASLATYDIGALAFYSGRPVLDLSARLQPVAFDRNFFFHYAPDALAVPETTPIPWKDVVTTYDRKVINGYAIYRRVVNFSALDDHGVDVQLGQQLGAGLGKISMHLVNVAIGQELHPGDLVRVRLDWELAYPPGYPVEIKLNLLNPQNAPVAGVTDQFQPADWHAGQISTYHLLVLPGDKVNDTLSLYLSVRVRGGDLLNTLKVAEVRRAGA